MTNDIMTALKMLKAKGGALDMKAAEIIEDLFAQVVAKRVGEKMADDKADRPDDRVAVFARQAHQIAQLTKEVVDLNAVLDGMKQMIDTLSEPAEKEATSRRDYEAVRSVLVKALQDVANVPWGLKAHHLADILAAEYRGAMRELHEVGAKLCKAIGEDYSDGVTPLLAADAAILEIQQLKMQLANQVRNRVVHVTIPSNSTLPPENLWAGRQWTDEQQAEIVRRQSTHPTIADLLRMPESDA